MITDGNITCSRPEGASLKEWLTLIHKESGQQYPKFYKMDTLSKAGFIAAEQTMCPTEPEIAPKEDAAVVLFSSAGSLDSDLQYFETVTDNNNYYPSPGTFVYTLANIVCGEIAIRHKIFGETMCYITKEFSALQLYNQLRYLEQEQNTKTVICGWCNVLKDECKVLLLRVELTQNQLADQNQLQEFTDKLNHLI